MAENEGRYDKEAVRGALPWMDFLCRKYSIELRRVGHQMKGLCPFHVERTPSFVVDPDKGHGHCFGCGWDGDEFAFFAGLEGLDLKAQFREVLSRMAGLAGLGPMPSGWTPRETKRPDPPLRREKIIKWPKLRRLSDETCEGLAEQRGLPGAAVRAARDAGLIWGCNVGVLAKTYKGECGRVYGDEAIREKEHRLEEIARCWVVSDGAGLAMQFRRLDSERWKAYNPETKQKEPAFKSDTLGTSKWTMGANLIGERNCVALVEGGPDILAAFHFLLLADQRVGSAAASPHRLKDVAVVEAISASVRIHPEALGYFTHKRVRIFAHLDKLDEKKGTRAGWQAAARWQEELTEAGAEVDVWDFSELLQSDGKPVGDLNEAALGDEECLREMAPAMDFRPSREVEL